MANVSKLALAGILGAGLTLASAGCGSTDGDAGAGDGAAKTADDMYKDIHECAGMNSCKGLGGCKVTAEKLEKLAKARGIDAKDAGTAHDCKGLNECKGLGGCSVDEEKLAKLKAKLAK